MLTLNDGRNELWQWDTGRKLTVDADCSQVHFSNKVFGRSIDVDVLDGVAIIPDVLLQTDKDLFAWAFVGTPENGYTKISKVFKVNRRNKPSDYVFTPPEQTTLGEILERLDDLESVKVPDAIKNAVEDYLEQNPVEVPVQSVNGQTGAVELNAEDVGAIAETELQTAINTALAQAKASGEFDGADGKDGADYILTDADKTEIAEMAAELVEVPDSGGNVAYDEEQELTEEQKAQARANIGAQPVGEYLTEVPEGYAKNEDIKKVDRKVDTLREVVSKFHSNIVCDSKGEVITVSDASDMELAGLRIFGKTTQNGTPTPEAPVPLVNAGNGGSITVKVGTSETDENPQTLTISTPNGLPGIPITSGGNYTDKDGQQWICDEVDFARGKYIQRIGIKQFANANGWSANNGEMDQSDRYYYVLSEIAFPGIGKSNMHPVVDIWGIADNAIGFGDGNHAALYARFFGITSLERLDTLFTATPLIVYYGKTVPTEIDLTEEELAAYAALHTNYPNTTIFNDGGTGMEVKYVADTKLYIDKKFAELSAALLNQ